jgi:hypothetical protein
VRRAGASAAERLERFYARQRTDGGDGVAEADRRADDGQREQREER